MKVGLTITLLTPNTDFLALAWVEYCNSDRPTYYANLRRQNGREKPYNVPSPPPPVLLRSPLTFSGKILGPRKRNVRPLASRPNDKGRLRQESLPMGQSH
jgi:hypothetical protein